MAALLAALTPAAGQVAPAAARVDEPAPVTMQESLLYLQSLDQKVADIAWRLASAGNDVCPETQGGIGIGLHDAAQYVPEVRTAAAAAFGFGDGYPAVLSLAKGSPAQQAGVRVGDHIIAIDGTGLMPSLPHDDAEAGYERIEALMTRLEAIPARAEVRFDLLRADEPVSLGVTAAKLCRVRVELAPGGQINADSDERLVQVQGKLATWVRSDDELAFVIAHEMGHVFLGHHRRLDQEGIGTGLFSGFGANGRKLRDMEREADRYGIFLAARAGFDYRTAGAFWRRLAKASGLGSLWAATHPNARNRGRNADRAVAEVDALRSKGLALTP